MAFAANLGFPRIGANRELKKAVEAFWKGDSSEQELMQMAADIREANWKRQKEAGLNFIPSNDFSLYDQVLDHIHMFGVVPDRYASVKGKGELATYFAMARGLQGDGVDVVAMEMTKWFDTNYHYIVPEFDADQSFELSTAKAVEQYKEAKEKGFDTRPVIIGPVTFLSLGKIRDSEASPVALWNKLVPVYVELLKQLAEAGATWVQIDEPCLALDLSDAHKEAYREAYSTIANAKTGVKLMLTTYFEGLRDNAELAANLPVDGLHIDLVRAPEQLNDIVPLLQENQLLSLGVVDGRNIWKTDLSKALDTIQKAAERMGTERLVVAPSCSLLHSPVDLDAEAELDDELKQWLAFAVQKLDEVAAIANTINGKDTAAVLEANAKAVQARGVSERIHNKAVKERLASVDDKMLNRKAPFAERIKGQEANLNLPVLPTTTIGSFPQTKEVRAKRAQFKKGELDRAQYDSFLEQETEKCIRFQEEVGLDVLVHGEFERNDMVEYFGEKLNGFAFTKFGWVQSYGSRCVKPPIIFGDVSRPEPMTVRWATFAQSKTEQVMKGMLTGPVTILQWSFVRDDQPRETTCKQIGLAIRDEVIDLEEAGIKVIQIDEAALREGLPLRRSDWESYLKWAVDSFRITASGVENTTQIHTHMCYSEFNDIIKAVAAMDADVISIETSRSAMELLDAFVEFDYPNQIGPGVYDIHSPRVPKQSEMEYLLSKALEVLNPEQLWVNPDCGLKTRGWEEVESALRAMVQAAKTMREKVGENRQAS